MEPIIRINGTPFPNPSDYKVDIEPLGNFERNANGMMVGDLIAVKTKLGCSWAMLEGEYYALLINAVDPFFVKVTYLTPSGGYETKEMYSSPQSGQLALRTGNGEYWWKSVTCNLIER